MKTDFVEIFQTIRASLQPYTSNGFIAQENSETNYELWSERNIVVDGKEKHELFFASVKITKSNVEFHLMATDLENEINNIAHPELLKLLNGKSDFQLTKLDDNLMEQIDAALAAAYTIYKQKEWI